MGVVPRATERGSGRAALIALIAAQVVASTGAGLALTVASVTVLELSGSERAAGLAQTAIVVGASILTLPVSRLAARAGRRASLAAAYAAAAVGALVGAMGVAASSWGLVLVGLAFVGGGTVAGLAARFAAADTASRPKDVALAIALVLWASTVGSLVGPNLVSLTGLGTSTGAFLLLAALYAGAGGIVLLAVPRTLGRSAVVGGRSSRAGALRLLAARPRALMGVGISAAVHIAMVALMAMAPVHLHHQMASDSMIGAAMSGHLAAMYALSPVVGLAVARWGARSSAVGSLALVLLAAVVLAVSASEAGWAFGAGLTLLGFGWSMGMVAGSSLIVGALEPGERAGVQGATDLVLNLGGGAASIVAGLVVAGAGYEALAVAFAIAVGLAALLAVLAPATTWRRAGV